MTFDLDTKTKMLGPIEVTWTINDRENIYTTIQGGNSVIREKLITPIEPQLILEGLTYNEYKLFGFIKLEVGDFSDFLVAQMSWDGPTHGNYRGNLYMFD